MTDPLIDRVTAIYDRYVAEHPDGAKIGETREAIRGEVRALVASTRRDIDREVDVLLNAGLRDVRSSRSRSLKSQIEYVLDGFHEDSAYLDPMFDQAYKLGTDDGADKTLRNWTIEDFRFAMVVRYGNAAEATASAHEFAQVAQRAIDDMVARGSDRFGPQ